MAYPNSTAPSEHWVNPMFAAWGKQMATQMTRWLYAGDPSYPYYTKPERWPEAGRVRINSKVLTFSSIATGSNDSDTMDFVPHNYILLARTAVAATTTASVNLDLVLYQEQDSSGRYIVEQQALSMIAGTGERPFILPMPDFVLNNERRTVQVNNNSGSTATIRCGWTIAYLDLQ